LNPRDCRYSKHLTDSRNWIPVPLVDAMTASLPPHSPTARVPVVLQLLREATAAQHKALEDCLPFFSPELDLPLYRRVIEAYYGFHWPLQQAIERFCANDPAILERRKVPALRKDLTALGLSEQQIDALPLCRDLPLLNNRAQLLGLMYVMEGATLGGQVLRRMMKDKLGVEADNGGEFLDVYGSATGARWKAFLAQLAAFDSPEHNPQVVAEARLTFACFHTWLERAGVLVCTRPTQP
jgi:heme oxygenase